MSKKRPVPPPASRRTAASRDTDAETLAPAEGTRAGTTRDRTASGKSRAGSGKSRTGATPAGARAAASGTKKKAGTASDSRRETLRAQQAAEARQKRAMGIIAIVCAVVALAIIATIGVMVWRDQAAKRAERNRESAEQVAPPNAVGRSAILVNPKTAANAQYTLELFVDYQCPVCKQADGIYSSVWKQLADEGFVKLQVHTMTFMEEHPQINNTDSTAVAIGAACADMRGKYWEFMQAAYKNQPENEGHEGYTDEAVSTTIAQQAGITGAEYDTWKSCLDQRKTAAFVRDVDKAADDAGVSGTPTIRVNGKNPQTTDEKGQQTEWWKVLDANAEAWKKAIAEAAKG